MDNLGQASPVLEENIPNDLQLLHVEELVGILECERFQQVTRLQAAHCIHPVHTSDTTTQHEWRAEHNKYAEL